VVDKALFDDLSNYMARKLEDGSIERSWFDPINPDRYKTFQRRAQAILDERLGRRPASSPQARGETQIPYDAETPVSGASGQPARPVEVPETKTPGEPKPSAGGAQGATGPSAVGRADTTSGVLIDLEKDAVLFSPEGMQGTVFRSRSDPNKLYKVFDKLDRTYFRDRVFGMGGMVDNVVKEDLLDLVERLEHCRGKMPWLKTYNMDVVQMKVVKTSKGWAIEMDLVEGQPLGKLIEELKARGPPWSGEALDLEINAEIMLDKIDMHTAGFDQMKRLSDRGIGLADRHTPEDFSNFIAFMGQDGKYKVVNIDPINMGFLKSKKRLKLGLRNGPGF
jgi:hypothetical protein